MGAGGKSAPPLFLSLSSQLSYQLLHVLELVRLRVQVVDQEGLEALCEEGGGVEWGGVRAREAGQCGRFLYAFNRMRGAERGRATGAWAGLIDRPTHSS